MFYKGLVLTLTLIIKILSKTYRFHYWNTEASILEKDNKAKGPLLVGLLHEEVISGLSMGAPNSRFCPLISLSKDGQLANDVIENLGFFPIRGSSSRGGEEAKILMEEAIQRGKFICLTLDGPRGPRRVPKTGILKVAYKTQKPVLILRTRPQSPWFIEFNSWDKFKLPLPFAKIDVWYTGPYWIKTEEDIEIVAKHITYQISLEHEEEFIPRA